MGQFMFALSERKTAEQAKKKKEQCSVADQILTLKNMMALFPVSVINSVKNVYQIKLYLYSTFHTQR